MFRASDYQTLLQYIEAFFKQSTADFPVKHNLNPQELYELISLELPSEGKPLKALETDIANYLAYAVRTAHPAYLNQLWGGVNPACFMGDMLTSAANTSMFTYEVAPAATLIENTLITKLGKLVGFIDPEGQFTTGGSNGNLMALAMARHWAVPNLKHTGLAQGPQLVAFVSEEAHYSFTKAVHLLGLGGNNLWPVPVDDAGKMSVTALEELIQKARFLGYQPFFVAATAGTTVRGAFDPLTAIGSVTKREKLWFHVDGAWGSSVLLSRQQRYLMAGVDQADSVVWDAHKMMGMTLTCSALLVKRRGQMLRTFSSPDTDYLFHGEASDDIGLGPSTLHCGRRADGIKLWLAWKHLGDHGWEAMIDRYFALAVEAEAIIDSHPHLQLVASRESLNLCFRYIPQSLTKDANDITLKIRQALLSKGIAMVNHARIKNQIVLRLVICNNQTCSEDLTRFFEQVVELGQQLETRN